MFNDDICWCHNSELEGDIGCNKKDCFRHMSNRKKPEDGPDIYTRADLKDTVYCPYYKEK